MKSKRLRRLQTWMIVVLFLYVLMLGYSSLVVPFQNGILFAVTGRQGQATTERRIESDKTVQELQDDIHVSTQNFSHALRVQRDLLHIYFYANVAVIGFLGWSTFTIFRIKREVDRDA
jgi:hypothetical protein